jgi:hypothetical protein
MPSAAGSAAAPAAAEKPYSWATIIDFVLNDMVVVVFSLMDVVCDILVAIEFYEEGKMGYFWVSVAIFCVAQVSYAFLFASTFAQGKGTVRQIAVFLCVLPVSQLMPFFTWVESFHFERLDRCLDTAGLVPTSRGIEQGASMGDDNDSLWAYIQHKYQAHAGFLAEALAEAIPQCILQTVAIITTGSASPLFVVSIMVSITVVASKGYMISYSIHRPVFVFNFLCIVADCFNLFASIAWLFSPGYAGAAAHSSGSVFAAATATATATASADPLGAFWFWLFGLGAALLCGGGFCGLWFSMFDDHLKLKQNKQRRRAALARPAGSYYTRTDPATGTATAAVVAADPSLAEWDYALAPGSYVWFDLYLCRLLAWVLAVLPVMVVFAIAKLTFIPVLVFGSLDPEMAAHSKFYRPLFRFLALPGTDLRLQTTNRFLLAAARGGQKKRLASALEAVQRSTRARPKAEQERARQQALRGWLADVGRSSHGAGGAAGGSTPLLLRDFGGAGGGGGAGAGADGGAGAGAGGGAADGHGADWQLAVERALAEADAAEARRAARHALMAHFARSGWGRLKADLVERSAIAADLFTPAAASAHGGRGRGGGGESGWDRRVRRLLRALGSLPFLLGVLLGAAWVPVVLACGLFGTLFPVLQVGVSVL